MNEAFKGFWKDLSDYYGKNQTNPKVIYEYEKEARGVPATRKQDLFSYIVRNYDYFPKLSEFSAVCAKYKTVKPQPISDERCVYCLGSGLIRYTRKVKGLSYDPEYFAACMCSKGRRYRGNPIKGIEDVYGARTGDVLKQLEERNAPRKSVSELKADFVRGMDIMNLRSQSFKKQTASS